MGPFFSTAGEVLSAMVAVSSVQERIQAIAAPLAAGEGLDLVLAEVVGTGRRSIVRLTIDRQGGVTLDDCARFSRVLAAVLEAEDLLPGPYDLEVSSPGLDRRLVRPEDFQRFGGRQVRITLVSPRDGRRHYSGLLLGLEGTDVALRLESGEQARIPLSTIKVARLVPEL